MPYLCMRHDFRAPAFGPASTRDIYEAALDQYEWADKNGFDLLVLSEHHGVDDGWQPAPLTMAGVLLGRTSRARVMVSAAILPLHDPVRIAEEIAVLDNSAPGRLWIVVGAGYRVEEFEMAGLEHAARGRILEEYVGVLLEAWKGEPFEWRGRTVRVTPKPTTPPMILIGGSTKIAARRAARLRAGFFPAVGDPALVDIYNAECKRVGFDGGFASLPGGPGFVHVSEDPERDWARIAPHALYDAQVYASWQTPDQRSSVHVEAQTADDVRKSGVYRVVTPDECVALANDVGTLVLHPLMGGMPPALGWASLELFAKKVLPRLRPAA
jgi:alkanesulfonate monooxygenase SsuD/methylene tetrahydromethanopterin reductase-like flavin-dependent oxidoreductase (luciferase family)